MAPLQSLSQRSDGNRSFCSLWKRSKIKLEQTFKSLRNQSSKWSTNLMAVKLRIGFRGKKFPLIGFKNRLNSRNFVGENPHNDFTMIDWSSREREREMHQKLQPKILLKAHLIGENRLRDLSIQSMELDQRKKKETLLIDEKNGSANSIVDRSIASKFSILYKKIEDAYIEAMDA